jgi:hypothetical protein
MQNRKFGPYLACIIGYFLSTWKTNKRSAVRLFFAPAEAIPEPVRDAAIAGGSALSGALQLLAAQPSLAAGVRSFSFGAAPLLFAF